MTITKILRGSYSGLFSKSVTKIKLECFPQGLIASLGGILQK